MFTKNNASFPFSLYEKRENIFMNEYFVNPETKAVSELEYCGADIVLEESDVLNDERLRVVRHYDRDPDILTMFVQECFENDLVPEDAVRDAISGYLSSFSESAEYTVDTKYFYPAVSIKDGDRRFDFEARNSFEPTGDLKQDIPAIAEEYLRGMDGDDFLWLVEEGCLDVDRYVPNTERNSATDRYFSFCVYMNPEEVSESREDADRLIEENADRLREYFDGNVYELRTYHDMETFEDPDSELIFKNGYSAAKEAEERGLRYLGSYNSVEECVKQNAEELDITLGKDRVAYTSVEKEYRINESPDFIAAHFPDTGKGMPSFVVDGDCFATVQGNIIRFDVDEFAESPRKENNVGTFLTFSTRYESPDENPYRSYDDFLEEHGVRYSGNLEEDMEALSRVFSADGGIILPVSRYEHGGVEYYVGRPEDHIDGRWDSGFAGVIYADGETLRKERIPAERAADVLEAEVKDYDKWVNNEIFTAVLYDRNGDEIDRVGGIMDPAEAEAHLGTVSKELGNYADIGDCIEDNLDALGIAVKENEVLKTREETTFTKKSRGR